MFFPTLIKIVLENFSIVMIELPPFQCNIHLMGKLIILGCFINLPFKNYNGKELTHFDDTQPAK